MEMAAMHRGARPTRFPTLNGGATRGKGSPSLRMNITLVGRSAGTLCPAIGRRPITGAAQHAPAYASTNVKGVLVEGKGAMR